MKKKCCIIVVLLIMVCNTCSFAEDEVTMLNTQWLSDDSAVVSALYDSGYLRTNNGLLTFSNEECYLLSYDNNKNVELLSEDNNDYCVTTSLKNLVKGKIAGYPISNIILTFAYNGDYKLIFAKVDLLGATYNDIKEKINRAYGDGIEYNTTEDIATIWKGANETCLALFSYYEGKSYELCYGRLDALEIIQHALEVNKDDITGL